MGFKKVETADGSITLYHPLFGESYHSVSAGAATESLKKFLLPSQLLEKAKTLKEVSILEVGFGLGYNFAVAVYHLLEVNPSLKLTYLSLDLEVNPLIGELKLPPPYGEVYEKIKENLLKGKTKFSIGGVEFELLLGDARKTIKTLGRKGFDAVFHDAFSPKRNPELWSYEFLREIKNLLKEDGFWVSYSTALPVRKALQLLGFRIYNTKPVGRKSPSTAATLKGKPLNDSVYPLSPKEEKKLLSSPKAVPYRDPCLCLDREGILKRYQEEVLKRENP